MCGTSALIPVNVHLPVAIDSNASLAVADPAGARTAHANPFVPIFSSAIYWRA